MSVTYRQVSLTPNQQEVLDILRQPGGDAAAVGRAGAERLGLAGTVRDEAYEPMFGPGGAVDPALGVRLAATKRPGMELIVAAHKSVALLRLMGRAEHMHELLDVERDATLAYLDVLTCRQGGRRGRGGGGDADVGVGVRAHPSRHVPGRRPPPP
jgi:hypothetical protein